MTSPLPIIVDSEDRGMKRPVEEVARAISRSIDDECFWDSYVMQHAANAVIDRLVQLGFLNDNYFVAKKAEEAGDEV